MARGDKSKFTGKQNRKAGRIAENYKSHGMAEDEEERIAWATVNNESGGGMKSGSGRAKPRTPSPSGRRASSETPAAPRADEPGFQLRPRKPQRRAMGMLWLKVLDQ
jgi:hypothetical protein